MMICYLEPQLPNWECSFGEITKLKVRFQVWDFHPDSGRAPLVSDALSELM